MEKEDREEREGLKEILEEAEILAELKEEEKIRKKNAKIILLASIAVLGCGVIFYFGQSAPEKEEMPIASAPSPQEEEMFPEAGKIKTPGEATVEMNPLQAPLSSEEDVLPSSASPPPAVEKGTSPIVQTSKPVVARAPVEAEKKDMSQAESTVYRIRVGPFVLPGELEQAVREVKALGLSPSTKKEKNEVPLHKVLVGPYASKEKAEVVAGKLNKRNIKGFITKMEHDYFVQVGTFYNRDSALRMKENVEKAGFFSRPLHEPSEISCDTLYASFNGNPAEAERKVAALRKKGFEDAKIISK